MTDPVPVLTDEERELLDTGACLYGWSSQEEALNNLCVTVESILAARLTAAKAEAWEEGVAAGHWEFSETHRRAHPTYIGKRELPKAPNPYRRNQ